MSKDLEVVSKDLEVAAPAGALALGDDEWGDVDAGFIGEAPPTAKPVVPRLAFNAKVGQGFVDELTGEKTGLGATLRVVWLAWQESRAYWDKPYDGANVEPPTCRSTNMIVPDDLSTEKQSTTCAACPHSQWGDNNVPPACNLRINAMLYLPEQQRITRTAFGGLALKHVQRYLGGFSTRLPQRPPMAFITEIEVASETTPNGEFLVPHFRLAGDITRGEAAPLIALRDELRKQWQELAEQDLANQDDSKGADPFAKPADAPDDIVYEDEPFFDDDEPEF